VTYPPQQGGGYDPQQQYPAGYGQQGYDQQGYGQPQRYPPQGGYGGPPPGFQGPQKNNTPMIIAIVAGVLVVALAVVLIVVLTGDDSDGQAGDDKSSSQDPPEGGIDVPGPNGGDPADTGAAEDPSDSGDSGDSGSSGSIDDFADKLAGVIEDRSPNAVDAYACTSSDAESLKQDLAQLESYSTVTATVEDATDYGDGTAFISISIEGDGDYLTATLIEAEESGGSWCAKG
jgi:hypothetical protein